MRRATIAFSQWSRRRKASLIQEFLTREGLRTSGLVGVGGGDEPNGRIVEQAVSDLTDVRFGVDLWPRSKAPWPYVMGDARRLPFADDSCDVLLCNAVIEHVGGREDQQVLVNEHTRVARAWVITTPNRWFPVESHTATVLRHWSPAWRSRRTEFTRLLSLREFRALLPHDAVIVGHPWSATFSAFYARGH